MKTQTLKIGTETGSITNWIMGNNATLPEVGKGATVLHWTDRHAYEVIEVSEAENKVVIDRYRSKGLKDNTFSEDQEYEYVELANQPIEITYVNGEWRVLKEFIDFKPSYYKAYEARQREIGAREAKVEMIDILFDENNKLQLINGKTKLKRSYDKINIVFGVKEEYYDPCF